MMHIHILYLHIVVGSVLRRPVKPAALKWQIEHRSTIFWPLLFPYWRFGLGWIFPFHLWLQVPDISFRGCTVFFCHRGVEHGLEAVADPSKMVAITGSKGPGKKMMKNDEPLFSIPSTWEDVPILSAKAPGKPGSPKFLFSASLLAKWKSYFFCSVFF